MGSSRREGRRARAGALIPRARDIEARATRCGRDARYGGEDEATARGGSATVRASE